MYSRVKTGDVVQIRKNGPNYIALGKVRDGNGDEYIAATKNGNISPAGVMKRASGARKPKIHILAGNRIKRVHGNRTVDMASVVANGGRRLSSHLTRTTGRNGVEISAPNLLTQIAELTVAL